MHIQQLIEETFLEMDSGFEKALGGLTPNELRWQPNHEANSIGFTYWHVGRAEDIWIHEFALNQSSVFEKNGWHQRWTIPVSHTGGGYTAEQVQKFAVPPLAELHQYYRQVRKETLSYLSHLKPDDFFFMPTTNRVTRKGYSIGRMFGHLLCEESQHLGHIAYIRGMLRGINQ